tara:strand:- start:4789 stop:5001 length:213 start_codon:yes stop_codon:yes gene_type:complete
MAFKMYGKTPMTKALVGKQKNLNANLRAAIEAVPETPKKNINNPSYKMIDNKSPMEKRGCGCKSGACMCK